MPRSMSECHALGQHRKVPRQKCADCKANRDAQWRALKPGTRVEYRDARVVDSVANGRIATIVRQCSKAGNTRQYVVEIVSCPTTWKPEHSAQQIGKLHFWWDVDFVMVPA